MVLELFGKNIGHRLGASGTKLENTIQALEGTITKVNDPKFKYWEFDVQETFDGELVVFHDDYIESDDSSIRICDIDYNKLVDCSNSLGITIPKYSEVFNILKYRNEPVMVEIKNLISEKAREKIFSSLAKRENWKLMATPTRFLRSLPNETRELWSDYANENNIDFVRVGRHNIDLFKSEKSQLKWIFALPKWLFGF